MKIEPWNELDAATNDITSTGNSVARERCLNDWTLMRRFLPRLKRCLKLPPLEMVIYKAKNINNAVQSRKTVTAYLTSKQLLPVGFAEQTIGDLVVLGD